MMRFACMSVAASALLVSCIPAASAQTPVTSYSLAITANATAKAPDKPAPIKDDQLSGFRGGQAITIANQTLNSIVSDPSIGGSVSGGAVNISDNALSNFNGLGNLVINTGSQVSLQSGMNVIVNVHQ